MKQSKRLVGVLNETNRPKVDDAQDAYQHLFDAIVDQRLLPGTKLTEMDLMEAFGVGRRAIGSALQRLTWEHLVVFIPRRGAFVAAPNAKEAREVFAARIAIESGTTEAVARAADSSAIARLKENIEQENLCRKRGDMRMAIHLSGGFHLIMAELSGNDYLAEQVRLLVARTSLIVSLFENQKQLSDWHDHHDDLIRHCENGDVEQAVTLMREHIVELQESLVLDRRRPISFDLRNVFRTDRSD